MRTTKRNRQRSDLPTASLFGLAIAVVVPLSALGAFARDATQAPLRATADDGTVRLTMEVTPARASIADLLTMTLTVELPESVTVVEEPLGDRWGDFRVREVDALLPVVESGREIRTRHVTLEPMRPGTLRVWGVPLSYRKTAGAEDAAEMHALVTEDLTVEVGTVVENPEAGLADLKPMAAPVGLPRPGLSPWAWGAIVSIAVAAAVALILLRRRARRTESPRVLSPRERAWVALDALIASQLASRDVKQFYVELTGIVRRYIEQTTGILAAEQTTEEFLREIAARPTFEAEDKSRLGRFLESADLVKFAAHRPGEDDIAESVDRARDFVGREAETDPDAAGRDAASSHAEEASELHTCREEVTR